jgi:CheY-like chemotaxis protein
MLAYSGKGQFVIEPLNLSKLVEEMAHLLEVSVSKEATLKYRFGPSLPSIQGDATQIRQVVMNLIINASDAIGVGSGVISVSTGLMHADRAYLEDAFVDEGLPEGDYVFLEVADTGAGMDVETQERIFDPFFTTKFTGRGLGLAAVLGIIRGHRGTVKLHSETGKGTTFKVLFPATEQQVTGVDAPARATAEGSYAGRTVLVVDDDETVRSVTRRILETAGISVLLAEDGAGGIAEYSANPGIDLVLLDMTMPRMDGDETFRELQRLDASVRVLLISGYNEQDATEHFAGKGLAGFVQKPYRLSELLEKIGAVFLTMD